MQQPSERRQNETRDSRLRSAEAFGVVTSKVTPAGLPKGMSWNSHDSDRARNRRLKQLRRQAQKDALRRASSFGDTEDEGLAILK